MQKPACEQGRITQVECYALAYAQASAIIRDLELNEYDEQCEQHE